MDFGTRYDKWPVYTKTPGENRHFGIALTRSPNGKRVFRSTKQTDHANAEEFRRGIDRASKHGAEGNLTESRARALISEIVEHTLG